LVGLAAGIFRICRCTAMLHYSVAATMLGSRHETGKGRRRGPQDQKCQQYECASSPHVHSLFSHRFTFMVDCHARFDSDPNHMIRLARCPFVRMGTQGGCARTLMLALIFWMKLLQNKCARRQRLPNIRACCYSRGRRIFSDDSLHSVPTEDAGEHPL